MHLGRKPVGTARGGTPRSTDFPQLGPSDGMRRVWQDEQGHADPAAVTDEVFGSPRECERCADTLSASWPGRPALITASLGAPHRVRWVDPSLMRCGSADAKTPPGAVTEPLHSRRVRGGGRSMGRPKLGLGTDNIGRSTDVHAGMRADSVARTASHRSGEAGHAQDRHANPRRRCGDRHRHRTCRSRLPTRLRRLALRRPSARSSSPRRPTPQPPGFFRPSLARSTSRWPSKCGETKPVASSGA